MRDLFEITNYQCKSNRLLFSNISRTVSYCSFLIEREGMKFTKCVLTSWTWQPLLCWCHALTRPKIPKGDQPVFPTERAPQFQFSVYCELAYFSSYLLSFWNQYSPCFTKLAKKNWVTNLFRSEIQNWK